MKVDKLLDGLMKDKSANSLEYRQIKIDYNKVISKKKALQKSLLKIIDDYDTSLKMNAQLQTELENEEAMQVLYKS